MIDDKIPYIVLESVTTRLERTIKRLWILTIILVVLLVGTNAIWLYYESQFEDTVKIEQEAEWDDNSNVIFNGTGSVNYGESKTNDNQNTQTENGRK